MSFDIDWTEHLLGEVCQITDCLHSTAPTVDYKTSFRMLRTSNIRNGRILSDDAKYVTEETYEAWTVRGKLEKDDVILTREAPMGEVGIIKSTHERYFLGQRMLQLRANRKKILPDFLYYSLLAPELQNQIKMHEGTGSVVSNIRIPALKKFKIRVPSIEIQEAVVGVLRGMDKKIDLNNAINKNLEEIAQALFKRWFVDFEFPNENGEPYKSSGGEFEESELGLIPKGWNFDSLDGIADYLNGLAMQKYRPNGEQFIPVIKIRELNQGRTSSDSDKASPDIDKKYIVNKGDVLFSWSGTLDIKLWCGEIGGLNQHIFKVTSKNYDKWFYYYWTKYYIDRFRRIASDKATTMGHIKRSDLKEAKVLIPDPISYRKATDIFKPIVDELIQLSVESFYLERVRDTLLPKLMSGEIRVPVEWDHSATELPKVAESNAIYQP